MDDVTVETVEAIHAMTMEDGKGDCRILSEANLLQLVFQANLIPGCVPRAAFVFYSLSAYPVFREGNERTAHELTLQILSEGGYGIDPAGQMQLGQLSRDITSFTTDIPAIGAWFAEHARKMK